MKIVELLSSITVPITNEQADLLNRFDHESTIAKNKLSEREQIVASQLTAQDILLRRVVDGCTIFKKKIK